MKFEIVDTDGACIHNDYVIRYVIEDFSFAYEHKNYFHDFSLMVNTIELNVDNNFFLCGISGYDPYLGWKRIHVEPPLFKKRGVQAFINFDYVPGGGYRINDQVWPEYVNAKSGWICIGNPQSSGEAVEFIDNCVAVIDGKQELVALWLKPQSLPTL